MVKYNILSRGCDNVLWLIIRKYHTSLRKTSMQVMQLQNIDSGIFKVVYSKLVNCWIWLTVS